jgi:hypothetical protein
MDSGVAGLRLDANLVKMIGCHKWGTENFSQIAFFLQASCGVHLFSNG